MAFIRWEAIFEVWPVFAVIGGFIFVGHLIDSHYDRVPPDVPPDPPRKPQQDLDVAGDRSLD